MHSYLVFLLTAAVCSLCLMSNAVILPKTSSKYQIANKEIHLKHGKLHPHDESIGRTEDEEHLIYRYRWLGDDIVKTEDDFEGDDDEDYDEKERKVKLPGGCELTEDQYMELELFQKETHYVKKCYCEQEGVYCQLNKALFKENLI